MERPPLVLTWASGNIFKLTSFVDFIISEHNLNKSYQKKFHFKKRNDIPILLFVEVYSQICLFCMAGGRWMVHDGNLWIIQ